ncbi:hypothetical protein BuS5_01912 [Desulfosarcina sp. BuS5]|nr:hypothetical protein BuS5_01912 [Desulfosarcina sp. BuS5]
MLTMDQYGYIRIADRVLWQYNQKTASERGHLRMRTAFVFLGSSQMETKKH